MNTSKNSWSELLYLKERKLLLTFIVIMIVVSSILGYLTPIIMTRLYKSIDTRVDFYFNLYALGGVLTAEYFAYVIYQGCIGKYIQHLLMHIRSRSFKAWLFANDKIEDTEDLATKYPLGEILSRVLSDTGAVIELVSSGSFKIFIDFAFIISCLISFINLNTTSGLALIVAEVLACAALIYGSKKMAVIYLDVRKATGKMSRMLANVCGGLRLSFYTPNGNYASKRSIKSFDDFLKKQLVANIWDAGYFAIAESLFPILLALLVLIFPYSNITEVAIIAAIIDLIQRSISPIKQIASKISGIQRARSGITRIREFNKDLDLYPKASGKEYTNLELKKFSVKVPSFKYPKGDFELKDINLEFNPGELIGIVGMSGCGKSTLLKILANQVVPKAYEVSIDSRDAVFVLDKTNQEEYRSQVSIVSQDSHVFTNSLGFNISLESEYDTSKLEKFWNEVLIKVPYLKRWGILLEDEINPKELSMGQKQLISALRSCYLSKPIVLFDEISSGLDSELEEALRKLVMMIQSHSLTIVVAHRIETIVRSDKIFVMEDGAIIDEGIHENLLSRCATYQEFINQLNGPQVS